MLVLVASYQKSLPLFLIGFILLFVFSGLGNGSTYKMIPTIFRSKAQAAVAAGADPAKPTGTRGGCPARSSVSPGRSAPSVACS